MGVTLNFDATNVQPAQALDPVPSGWYTAIITASEMKPTDKPGGMYLELEETIQEPAEYRGRKVFDRLNLQNANPVAVEIAYKQLSAICHAVGVIQVASSDQLHNRPLLVKVQRREAGTNPTNGQQYEANNEVKGYKAAGQAQAAQPIAPPPIAPPPVSAAPPAPAWAPPATAAPQPPTPPAWAPPAPPAAAATPPAPPWAAPQQQQPAPPPPPAPPAAAASPAPPWAAPQQQAAPAAQPGAPAAPPAPPWAQPPR